MKFASFSLLVLVVAFASCTSNSSNPVVGNLEKTSLQPFTDTVKQDTFKIALNGKTSKDMSLFFTITNFNGEKIYEKELKAADLLKNFMASAELKKEADKVKFLQDEVNDFFEEEHFLVPAVMPDENPDENVPDKAFYEELKQSGLNGFDYSTGKEDKVYIAWSVKEKKVKIYYNCCQLKK